MIPQKIRTMFKQATIWSLLTTGNVLKRGMREEMSWPNDFIVPTTVVNRYYFTDINIFMVSAVGAVYVSNLTPICLRCLCHAASGCNLTLGCVDGFCGPFQLNRAYWRDAGGFVLPGDSPSRDGGELILCL